MLVLVVPEITLALIERIAIERDLARVSHEDLRKELASMVAPRQPSPEGPAVEQGKSPSPPVRREEKAPPPPDLYTPRERNEITVRATRLAVSCLSLHGGAGQDDPSEQWMLTVAIHDLVMTMARSMPGVPSTAFCDALERIERAMMSTPTGGAIATTSAELEHIRRSLTMLLNPASAG